MKIITLYYASHIYPHPYIGPGEIVCTNASQTLPACSSLSMPEHISGFWPCLGPDGWRQVEDHRGSVGWLNGKQVVIKNLGPLPLGFSWDCPAKDEPENSCKVFTRIVRGVAKAV